MIDLTCIGGSRSYNLQTPSSDVDLLIMANNDWTVKVENKDGYNILYLTPDNFYARVLGDIEYPPIWQFLYPQVFTSDNEIVDYVVHNRDSIVSANLPYLYRSFSNCFHEYTSRMEDFYLVARKRICYGLLYASVLYNHANGLEFAKCIRPDGVWHDTLLRIRTKDASLKECIELKDEYKRKIESVEKFYDKPTDVKALQNLNDVICSFSYMTYDEIKEKKLIAPLWDTTSQKFLNMKEK